MISKRLYLVAAVAFIASAAVLTSSASAMRAIVYVTSCPSCSEQWGIDPFTPYILDLKSSLKRLGITEIEVRYLSPDQTQELDLLYQEFGVPKSMRGLQVVVDVDGKFLFVNFVPVELIIDFLARHSEEYPKLVVYRDLLRELYVVMDESRHIKECDIKNSISECIGDVGLLSSSTGSVLPLVVVGGLLDGINPCAFSLLLFFVSFIFAMSETSLERSRQKVLITGLVYIIGVYLAYLMIGLGLITIMPIAPFPHFIGKIAALLVIVLGAISLKDYFFHGKGPSLVISDSGVETVKSWMNKLTIPSAFIAGSLVGVFEFPCTGAIYIAITGILAQQAGFLQGFIYLLVYNVAFTFPLIVLCFFASRKFYYNEIIEYSSIKCSRSLDRQIKLAWALAIISLGSFLLFSGLV